MPKITIEVSDSDYEELEDLASTYEVKPKDILKQFVNDLVCNNSSGGSDERDLASSWFYRSEYNF